MNWEQPAETEEKQGMGAAQAGSILFMLLTIAVLLLYVAIFLNPQSFLNPFKPLVVQVPTPTVAPPAMVTPTVPPTWTPPSPFPPTWTPTSTSTPTMTRPPTLTPTPTPTGTPTYTPRPLPAFSLRMDPIYTSQIAYDDMYDHLPESQWPSRWWSGVAGEVTNRAGDPVMDVTIKIWDDFGHVWQTKPGDVEANTGVRYWRYYDSAYGSRGTRAWWDQFLGVSCQESIAVHVQAISGNRTSNVVDVRTTGECKTNLILIHFQKNY
ncbi:MAG: hypothetical protein JXA09_11555 [Anaerolineae bacterium]|nr:hypothetical protein [Anaerolineae bacterium]